MTSAEIDAKIGHADTFRLRQAIFEGTLFDALEGW
jgi:hypothetical protein